MFKSFWGSQEKQDQQQIPTNSWYPPPSGSSTTVHNRFSDRPQSLSPVSPSEAAGFVSVLKDKSLDELRKLLSDKDAYYHFLLSLDQVKTQNNVRDELRKETVQLARSNLEKEPQIMELRNQCRIIRTTELAASLEKLNELERQKGDILKFYSPSSLLQRLEDAMKKNDEESERLHEQLVEREIEVSVFVQKYKKIRNTYHRRALTHLAAKTSLPT
ncbi:vacuolar protein-sorting-associated protein 37 homolog 1-like [Impatiens glandulifera]|uniref:vacuolar protein-sorting-associated protein 37 homolog 1-like n=1 Tax=Impatiens glandulifera TaxID=253017 RepID=UPI001FB15FF0|nr:vacuolar protein-sorting-associated protein 37 homolog 1-like [Impatiens glandulifera]